MEKIVRACKVQNILRSFFDFGMIIVCILIAFWLIAGFGQNIVVLTLIYAVGIATLFEGAVAVIHYYTIRKKICNCMFNMARCHLKAGTDIRVKFRNIERYYLYTSECENSEWLSSCIKTLKIRMEPALGQKVRFYYNDVQIGE